MRIGEVIGSLTLSKAHPSVAGGTWLVVTPLLLDALMGNEGGREEPIVVYDEWGAGLGAMISLSEGGEAAAPFNPKPKPLDAYNSAILDHIEMVPPGS